MDTVFRQCGLVPPEWILCTSSSSVGYFIEPYIVPQEWDCSVHSSVYVCTLYSLAIGEITATSVAESCHPTRADGSGIVTTAHCFPIMERLQGQGEG